MITGMVRKREARIHLQIQSIPAREIEAVVDTGYTGCLTLPPALELKLPWHSVGKGLLADGSICLFDIFVAKVKWLGKSRRVLVDQADADPLIGMAMLSGCELNLEVRSRGKVTIKRLPKSR